MEIITGVERRRRWRAEDKLRVLAEAEEPGARTSEGAVNLAGCQLAQAAHRP